MYFFRAFSEICSMHGDVNSIIKEFFKRIFGSFWVVEFILTPGNSAE
jgi:hypothetical protein